MRAEILETGDAASRVEAVAHVANGAFDFALSRRPIGATGTRREAVAAGRVEERRLETAPGGAALNRTLAAWVQRSVSPQLTRPATPAWRPGWRQATTGVILF